MTAKSEEFGTPLMRSSLQQNAHQDSPITATNMDERQNRQIANEEKSV
jgi:hypothetical protein